VKRIDYSAEAEADIDGIYDYSVLEWGGRRADRYVVDIRLRVSGLMTGRTSSGAAEEVGPGLRRALAGRHVVLFS